MRHTRAVKSLLAHYESDSPGTRTNLARMLMHGRLAGTGKLVILPVDQGFEHGPDRSFAMNTSAYDPHFLFKLAVEAGVSAFAAPLGLLETGAQSFCGQVPLILKINSGNSLYPKSCPSDQAVTGSIQDALRLGCVGIGFTVYGGSESSYSMLETLRDLIAEAKSYGLFTVVWSYPRGPELSKDAETAVDVVAYGAHMAALMGAHVIKVKLPSAHLGQATSASIFNAHDVTLATLAQRVQHIVQSCFSGRRMVVFSGGETKTTQGVLDDALAIVKGGGHGSIIGRNCFQRPYAEAMQLISDLCSIYRSNSSKPSATTEKNHEN